MTVEKIPLSIAGDLLEQAALREPHNRSGSISAAMKRYFDLLKWQRRELKTMFSEGECGLILDSLNGTWLGDNLNIRLIPANIEGAIDMDRLDDKWSVDGDELKAKLASLSVAQLYAVADAVDVWWNGQYSQTKKHGILFDY
jgi:hypothetical protein